jgi:hypothetical protein
LNDRPAAASLRRCDCLSRANPVGGENLVHRSAVLLLNHQRVVFGELTPKGRMLMDKVFPAHVDRLRQVTAGLSASEKRAAAQLLRRLTQAARRVTGERTAADD